MSQINFIYWNKYHVKLSNHGYVEIYDRKCLAKLPREGSWIKGDVDNCLLTRISCDSGVVDHDSIDDCRRYARIYLDKYTKSHPTTSKEGTE